MRFLTPAELRSLVLTLVLLAAGAGIRLWQGAQVRLGPGTGTAAPGGSIRAPELAASSVPLPATDTSSRAAGFHLHEDPPRAAPSEPDLDPDTAAGHPLIRPVPASPPMEPPVSLPPPKARSRPEGGAVRKAADVKVQLNSAGLAELAQVPGIGGKTAQAILAYRKANGPFLDIRELLNVKGIGEKKLERMAPCLILSPVREEDAPRQARLPP